jgi:hypothetical protein
VSCFESIDQSIADRPLHIRFFHSFIGHSKAGTKEDLMKIGMSTGEPSDLFFCEDVDFPWLFRDDFHWFAK